MIEVENVSMKFRMSSDKIQSIKEFVVAAASRRLKYKQFTVFEDVSFTVEKGEVVGIIGRNGAGKSTLLKIIAGILTPTKGTVRLGGKVVPMLELGSGFDPELTGKENIFLNGAILGYSEEFLKSKYDEILAFSGLGDFIDTPIRNYSSGMMMRLAFSVATIVQPEILIVDEILAVGDEAFQKKSKRKMLELMGGGTTVLFVSHSIAQIREMCNRVIWLENGQVKMQGKTKYVCDRYQDYLSLPGKSKDKRYQSSDAVRNLSNVLFIYGDDENAYEWRVTYQREQLVAAGVATNEIYAQMIGDDLAKLYRLFICVKCPDTSKMRSFLARAREWGKTILFDFSLCSDTPGQADPQSFLLQQLPGCCDGVIASSQKIAQVYQAQGYPVYENQPTAEEDILRYAALAKHTPHAGGETQVGLFCQVSENPALIQMLKEQPAIRLVTGNYMETAKIDFISTCSQMDLLVLIGTEETQELLLQQWICASFVQVPCFLYAFKQFSLPAWEPGRNILTYSGRKSVQEELAAILNDTKLLQQIGRAAYQDAFTYHSSAYTGDRLGQFVKSRMKRNAVFLISDLAYAGPGQVACHHAVLLKKKGYDVLLLTNGKEQKNMMYDGITIPVISRDVVYSFQFFDIMAAFDWESVQWMQNYPNAGKRFYLVQGFETDYYLPGNIKRLQANQMYTPHVTMKYAAASAWCKKWLWETYKQDAVLIQNGIAYEAFSGGPEKFAGEKIRILLIGNGEVEAENLSEAFAVTNLLSRERYEICFYPYGGNLEEWGPYDRLYCCQNQEQVCTMYWQCDILLLTSKNMCCQTAPLEMMAAKGVAVVMQDASNADYLEADVNCAIFPPGDVQAAAAYIQRIADDTGYRDRLVQNGMHTAKAYDWGHIDKDILRFYAIDSLLCPK